MTRTTATVRAVFTILAAAIVALGAVILFVDAARRPAAPESQDRKQSPPASSAREGTSRPSTSNAAPNADEIQTSSADADEGRLPPWLSLLASIVSQNEPANIVAARLAAVLPTLPPEGQLEAARQIVELQTDEDYAAAEDLYFSPVAPQPVKRLIFEDLMNRPNFLKLPLLVRTVGQPAHPLRPEALENLQLFVGRDVGDDPLAWQSAVDATLTEQRLDQEAARAPGP